jgi:hypothetical protein
MPAAMPNVPNNRPADYDPQHSRLAFFLPGLLSNSDLLCWFAFAGLAGQTQDEQGQSSTSQVTDVWIAVGEMPTVWLCLHRVLWFSVQAHGPPCLMPSSVSTQVRPLLLVHPQ